MEAFIKRSFPVPRFLLPPRLSVDACDGRLRFFEFSRRGGSYKPKAFGTLPFPRVHIGKMDEKEQADARTSLGSFARERGYRKAHVIAHEGEAYVFCVTVRTLNPREIRLSIESVLEENVPIAPSEAVFEYDILETDRVRGETLVAVSVISEKTLLSYVDLFKSAGLSPVSFQTESRALAHALFASKDRATRIVVSVGTRHTAIFVTQGNVVVFSSVVDVGSADIEASISRAFGVSVEEAKSMKEQRGFAESEDPKLFEAMSPVFSIVRDEVGKVFVYWKGLGKKGHRLQDISEIVLCGKDSALAGLSRYLSLSSGLPARPGFVWTGTSLPEGEVPELSLKESLDYGSVIGALI